MTDAEELFEERAAIAEFDGGLSRPDAEAMAAQARHRHEVRYCIAQFVSRGEAWLDGYLADVARARGDDASRAIRADMREQWKRGNRGDWGDWR